MPYVYAPTTEKNNKLQLMGKLWTTVLKKD